MSEECTHNCETCSANCASKNAPQDLTEKLNEYSSVKKVIAVVSGKGGVGKSMVTSLLSVLSNRAGYHTAVLDADITGPSIPKAFGLKEKATGANNFILPAKTRTGIDAMSINLLLDRDDAPVVWRGPVIAGAVKQFWTDVIWNDVDFMFVDMPPGTGDVPLTVFQSLPVDGIVIVTSPQELVSMIVAKAVNMAKMMNIPVIGIVENMSYLECPDCGKKISVFGESHVEETAEKYGLEVIGKLPIDPKLAAACDAGLIELFDGNWLDAAAEKIFNL
ncbi:MAG: Mrp/NBP35 family ATP-binding protein [Clostridia bacterium]|nr:Mrp/NBP35 family ATP-binding protein [Clostridia bacterium]